MGQTTTSTVAASGATGTACRTSGPYQPIRHRSIVVVFKQGDHFPADPVDGNGTTWAFISPATVSAVGAAN